MRHLTGRGVVVAVGHSQATADEVDRAVTAGASSVTHLFNAMSPLHHREPGVAGRALSDERLDVGLIVDGIHVDPSVVAVAERALGERLVLVSDAVALLGVDGVDTSRGVRLPDGTLAGSVLPLVSAVANLVAFSDCSPERALHAASTRPAEVLHDRDRGTLASGARADLVVLTPDLDLRTTIVGGAVLHHAV
ncbi:amidohydrolase family protein [Actinospongicola halichondriae]|uniref:amidohydrolase family protein n=1 Tax=Actinospongicola halichondriae TaxID=3236844 RepID=UPI003D58EDC3